MDNFLIIRLSSLGDIIHTLPSFTALRKKFPGAYITWAVEGKGKDILDLVPGIDEVALIERKNWLGSVHRLRRKDQTALDFQGLIKSASLALLSRSRRRIGFNRRNCREPLASLLYTERAEFIPEDKVHVIRKNLNLLKKLGIKEETLDFPLFVPGDLRNSVEVKLREAGFEKGKKLLLLNVGAAWETKRWSPEKWVDLAPKIKFVDAFPLLLWGSEAERDLAVVVQAQTGIALAPYLTLKEVIGIVREASLLISGDTFALQAACALSVPVVGIFGPTNPGRNGPFLDRDKVVSCDLDCWPCYKRKCSTTECLQRISAQEVAEAALELWSMND